MYSKEHTACSSIVGRYEDLEHHHVEEATRNIFQFPFPTHL